MSPSVRGQTFGVEFLLDATNDERRAIKAVDLFIDCAMAEARERGRDMLQINNKVLHECFPDFAKSLFLNVGRGDVHLYKNGGDGLCEAVVLHERAYKSREDGQSIARLCYLFPDDPEVAKRNILEKAADTGAFSSSINYGAMLKTVGDLLREKSLR
jgi:hypothetical protein